MELDGNSDITSDYGADHDSLGHFLVDSDEDNESYIDTERMAAVFNIADPPQNNGWPSVVQDFNRVTDSDNEEEYLAVRKLALYGKLSFSYSFTAKLTALVPFFILVLSNVLFLLDAYLVVGIEQFHT
jgi:hypothetical protein